MEDSDTKLEEIDLSGKKVISRILIPPLPPVQKMSHCVATNTLVYYAALVIIYLLDLD